MTNNKKIIIWIVIVLLAIILGVYIFVFLKKIDKTSEKPKEEKKEVIVEEKEKINEDYVISYLKEKLKVSKGNYDNDFETMKKAILERNTSLCDKLEEYSRDDCFFDIAVVSKNSRFCKLIDSEKIMDTCWEKVAREKSDNIRASKGKSPYSVDRDIVKKAVAEDNYFYCGFLLDFPEDECYHELAIARNNSNLCEKIGDDNIKIRCLEWFLKANAVLEKDTEKCLKLSIDEIRNQCMRDIFRKMGQIDECSNLDGEIKGDCQDVVYKNMAYAEGNGNICSNINNEMVKFDCLLISNDKLEDTDGDRILDVDEIAYGTDPFNPDTDGDGYDDGEEIKGGYDPLSK